MKSKWNVNLGGGLTTLDQINFVRHLGTILNTGTDILTALDIIGKDAVKPIVSKIAEDLKDRISGGETLSQAITRWEKKFEPTFISLIKAAEEAGNLPETLLNYAKELKKNYTLSKRLKNSLTYPVILICALTVMIIIIFSIVTPRIKELFISTGAVPPLPARMIFAASDLWLQNTLEVVVAIIALIVIVFLSLKNKTIRRRVNFIFWHLPVLNKVQRSFSLMRLTKTLAVLLDAGVSLKESLIIASHTLEPRYEKVIRETAEQKIETGTTLGEAMKAEGRLFPSILVSSVVTGEKSGALSESLAQMGEFYEEEVTYMIEFMLSLVEPVLIIFVGLIIGTLAASLLGPVFRTIGTF